MIKYEKPNLELMELQSQDVICTSGGVTYGGWSGDNDSEWNTVN